MGQYECHVFVCTSGETCPTQGDTERFVKILRDGARQAGKQSAVRVNKAGCFSQCGHGPMIVIYPDDVWNVGAGALLEEILTSSRGPPVECRHSRVPGANKMSDEDIARCGKPAPGRTRERSGRVEACARAPTSRRTA
jgi:(2Fe-2S) ferredoxin